MRGAEDRGIAIPFWQPMPAKVVDPPETTPTLGSRQSSHPPIDFRSRNGRAGTGYGQGRAIVGFPSAIILRFSVAGGSWMKFRADARFRSRRGSRRRVFA